MEILLALVERDSPLVHQPKQIAEGGNVVEAVVVHADMRDMLGHVFARSFAADGEKPSVAGGVKLQQRRAKLEPLRPFRPAARRVSTFDREHRRAALRLPGFLDAQDLLRGKLEQARDFGDELLRREREINFCRHNCRRSGRR